MYYIIMQYQEFHERVRRSGLTVKGFAEFVGMDRKSVSNYSKKGEVPNHLALIAFMLAELAKCEVRHEVIKEKFDALGRLPRKRIMKSVTETEKSSFSEE